MEFGRLRGENGEIEVPSLPPEHPSTTDLLTDTDQHGMDRHEIERALELFPPEKPVVRIGLSTWGDKNYRGVLYPADAIPGDFLEHYGQIFATAELSATFYGMPEARRLAAWRDAVPETFRFVPKVSQSITHRRGLADAQQGLRDFMERTMILGERRGPVLLQMPPRFAPTAVARDRLSAALAVLGRQAAVELRHPAWFGGSGWNRDAGGSRGLAHDDRSGAGGSRGLAHGDGSGARGIPPAAELLREYGAALVVTDTMSARNVVHTILTAPVLVLRFVAIGDAVVDGARVDQWTRQILDWLRRGLREVYVYVHLDDAQAALMLAERFASGLAAAQAIIYHPRAPRAEDLELPESPIGRGGISSSGGRGPGRGHGDSADHGAGGSDGHGDRDGVDHAVGDDSHGQLSLF